MAFIPFRLFFIVMWMRFVWSETELASSPFLNFVPPTHALWTFHGALRQFVTNLVRQRGLGAIYKFELSTKESESEWHWSKFFGLYLPNFGLTIIFCVIATVVWKEDSWQIVVILWKVHGSILAESNDWVPSTCWNVLRLKRDLTVTAS